MQVVIPTSQLLTKGLTSGVTLRIYYSCEYLFLHEVFAHYFMIFGLMKIGYVFFHLVNLTFKLTIYCALGGDVLSLLFFKST